MAERAGALQELDRQVDSGCLIDQGGRSRLTREALADVDAGHVIDH